MIHYNNTLAEEESSFNTGLMGETRLDTYRECALAYSLAVYGNQCLADKFSGLSCDDVAMWRLLLAATLVQYYGWNGEVLSKIKIEMVNMLNEKHG